MDQIAAGGKNVERKPLTVSVNAFKFNGIREHASFARFVEELTSSPEKADSPPRDDSKPDQATSPES